MTEPTTEPPETRPEGRRRGLLIGIGALVAVVVIAFVVYLVTRDDGTDTRTAATTTSAATTSTSTSTSAPATTAPVTVPVDTATAVWPYAAGTTRYADPVAAARGFATDFVGFTNPVVGEFRQGDTRSGEVPVQPEASGPETTVLVRQLGDSWWVIGATTANIQLTSPAALATITSPVRLQGTSTAFEGTVNTQVRQDGSTQPIGSGLVMGGGSGTMGPFDGTLTFSQPSAPAGALVLLTVSPKDGTVSETTVVRVKFS
jgi:Immunoglobulin-like domain of bacterial spore germination